jgi:sulfide dehydrogenase [flavocytochrome c] flavoprotein subunit
MSQISRRNFIKLAGAAGAATGLTLAGCAGQGGGAGGGGGRVVIVGGGSGGATAAKYIRKLDPSIQVTLIEPHNDYVTCYMSNWVIGGLRDISSITQSYANLVNKHGVKVVHDTVTEIDAAGKKVKTKGGETIAYDRCIVAPGIDFRWDTIEGYDPAASEKAPHAWKAGPQTVLLKQQLDAMPNGGVFVIAAPPNPFRCPPGPYERVSLVANYMKENKPNSKIIVLDSKDKFSKQDLFMEGWRKLYGYETGNSLIDWRPRSDDGMVRAVNASNRVAITEFEEIKADVLNVIPAQKAGHIAQVTGLTDGSGWCPVDDKTFESTLHKGIHVLGDASIASPMPKSGYAANSQAKVVAAAVVAMLNGKESPTPTWINTCYSLVGPHYGISVAMVYDLTPEGKVGAVKGAGGLTPKGGNHLMEAIYAESWYNNITDDIFG